MLVVNEHPNGTLLTVRARAGGRINGVTGIRQGALLVSVTQVAEKGKANAAVVSILAELFGCGKHQIELIRGSTSPNKHLLLVGIAPDEVLVHVKAALNE